MLPGGMVGYVEMALSVWFYLVASDKQTLVKKREREKSKQTYVISFHCNNRSTILCVQTSKGRYESGLYLRSYRTILIFGLTTPNEVKKAYFHIALSAQQSSLHKKLNPMRQLACKSVSFNPRVAVLHDHNLP